MKLYFLLLTAVLTAGLSAQTIFVDIDNTSPGDGTSWATAYTDLNQALLDADAGSEVWIAAGTYVTPETSSFFIDKELTVLGGFAGMETSAAAADPDANPTILSGDVMGNDGTMGYDSLLYLDNNRVLFITDTAETSSYTVTLDGFSIVHGGVATEIGDLDADGGAGLRTFARLNASRLKFSSNFSAVGSAIFIRFQSTDGTVFDNIEVSDNFTGGQRNVYIRDNIDVEFRNSTFIGEGASTVTLTGMIRGFNTLRTTFRDCNFSDIRSAVGSGGIAALFCADLIVDGCSFANIAAGGRGGAIGALFSSISVSNSDFEECEASEFAGAIYAVTDEDGQEALNISNTTFNLCSGATFGGAVTSLAFDTSMMVTTIDNATFTECTSTTNGQGAACYIQILNSPATITNSIIEECNSRSGAISFNSQGPLTIRNTEFTANGNATTGRGALVAFMSDNQPLIIDSCLFQENLVNSIGGFFSAGGAALILGGNAETAPMTISNTRFISNAAAGAAANGGALYIQGAVDLLFDNCDFDSNTSGSSGGAIDIATFELLRDTSANDEVTVIVQPHSAAITNSRFTNNLATVQGGAINTARLAFDLTNNIFVNNTIDSDGGSGGAIIYNGVTQGTDDNGMLVLTGDFEMNSTMVNNTFVNNRAGGADGAVGNDFAVFQEGNDDGSNNGSANVSLLNNAFLQTDNLVSVEIELGRDADGVTPVGDINFTSLGGNYYNNESDPDLGLDGADDTVSEMINDFGEINSLFVDLEDDTGEGVNLQLAIPADLADNPLINNGVVSDLVPDMDIVGNPRGDAPDIGAYEADQAAVSTGEPLVGSGLEISFFPNPTKDVLNVRNDEASIDRFTVIVSDQNGRVLKARQLSGVSNQVDFTNVPAGVYNLQVVVKGKIYGQKVVKQ